ncbi:hypothetical protein HHK36_027133 [Tetracentron sinense]|uniref:Uncharacterized protein n=1 Tax=Tetracentron sinense TaxID=13715 RepID=A0A834YMN1_TETSI|nr:hypothetical protein HHK36_027133 [Tetracentron sinense]
MALVKVENVDELLKAQAHVLNQSVNFINSMSLKCAVQLGIPDIIHHHGRLITLSELVTALAIPSNKSDNLRRLMRLLRLEPTAKAFKIAHGTTLWDFANQHTKFNDNFNEAMASDTRLLMSVVKEYGEVFQGLKSLVDVGGGTGTTIRMISEAFLQGDEDCVKILKRCKEAIPSKENGGKVIIMDIVVKEDDEGEHELNEIQLCVDVIMMVKFRSKERNEREWQKIFDDVVRARSSLMALVEVENVDELLKAQTHVLNQILNFVNSMSLKCAVQLGIPDIIHHHGQPISLSELVAALSIPSNKSDSLRRLMRLLVHSGFISIDKDAVEEESYLLTPSSRLLVKENPVSMLSFLLLRLDPIVVTPFHFLSDWFRQDKPTAFKIAHGTTFWDFANQNSRFNGIFNEAMASDTRLLMSVVIKEYGEVFQGLRSLVDVGGGTGTTIRMISEAFPQVKCTILELPHVVAAMPEITTVESVGGDMFESIPQANAVLLKMRLSNLAFSSSFKFESYVAFNGSLDFSKKLSQWILHNWSDEDSVKILSRCKEAIPSKENGGKVIILDIVVKDEDKGEPELKETQLCFDMVMMVNFGSKERNEHEWQKIFVDAGFTEYKIKPVLGIRSIIEVYP